MTRATLAAALAALALTFDLPRPAQAAEPWGAPYCHDQPMISAVFDHQLPRYGRDGVLRLFTGADIAACPDPDGARPGYDGHSGWDFTRGAYRQGCGVGLRRGQAGSLVYAVAAGRVGRSRWDRPDHDGRAGGYGLVLTVAHDGAGPEGQEHSLYGHLAALFVEEGAAVRRGQLVGALGTTGNSGGPHLHFQAARGAVAASSADSWDPYGWSDAFDERDLAPAMEDPHRGRGWSRRAIVPGQAGPPCPAACGAWVVEEDDPAVEATCVAVAPAGSGSAACPPWERSPGGHDDHHQWVPSAGAAETRALVYRCAACPPGAYLIEAYIPGGDAASTHVARYQVGPSVTVLDQHAESDVWHALGAFTFLGQPEVELSDRGDRHDFIAPPEQRVAADALRFTRLCGGVPAGATSVGPPRHAPGGGR